MSKRKVPAFKRAGLHKLECDCGAYVYATVSALERHGLPVCPCGEAYSPERWQLCMILGLDDAPAMSEYRDTLSGALKGQAAHKGVSGGRKNDPHECRSMVDLERNRAARARARRIGALVAPTDAEMPF